MYNILSIPKLLKSLMLSLIILALIGPVYSQRDPKEVGVKDCILLLEDSYEAGDLHRIVREMPDCLRHSIEFSREKKAAANHLMTRTYLALNELAKADSTVKIMLELAPEYQSKLGDPVEFQRLVTKFRPIPRFIPGIKAGGGGSVIQPLKKHSLSDPGIEDQSYSPGPGFQAGFNFDTYLTQSLFLSPEILFRTQTFDFKAKSPESNPLVRSEYSENLSYVGLDLSLRYEFENKGVYRKITPFIRLGGGIGVLLKSEKSLLHTSIAAQFPFEEEYSFEQENLNTRAQRRNIDYSLVAGTGLSLRLGIARLYWEGRMRVAGRNITESSGRYANSTLTNSLFLVDGDLKLHSIEAYIGFMYPIYHAKQRK